MIAGLEKATRVGRYTLVEKLGAGSMGEVWRAKDDDGGDAALKIPRRPAFLRHLKREGVLLAQVDHPRVAKFLACDTAGETPFLATELVRGESLRGLCRGTISSQEATLLCDQILDGLAAIHAAGILHLDLKPENVLIQKDGSAKIVDLGLGKATSAFMAELFLSASLASRDIPLAGTLAYMAPEQRRGKNVTERADLFAFGVLLHELLAGKLPEPSKRLSKLRTDLTPRWDVIVAKLTHPDALERPRTATEARQLISFTLSEKMTMPVASGGHEPRDLATFDEEAFAYESPWSPGMVVGDHELEALLGRGGFGEVWRAKRTVDEGQVEKVALKLAIRDEARSALGQEAALAARIQHGGVPLVLADRSKDEPPHVVFQLVEGESLRALINEDGLIPLDEGLAIMRRMVDVVGACHEAGVIHRDLKPEHFLVKDPFEGARDGTGRRAVPQVKLIDFGLAAIVAGPGAHSSIATGDARGTFDYMAPEQRDGRDVGTPADIYALGVCFFEMLADELPRGPQSLKQLRREVPDDVDRLVVAMLAQDPWQRPTLRAVSDVLSGSTPSQARVRARAASRLWVPLWVISVAVGAIAGVIFVVATEGDFGARCFFAGLLACVAGLIAQALIGFVKILAS